MASTNKHPAKLPMNEELVFGLLAPIGADKDAVVRELRRQLEGSFGYHVEVIKVSQLIEEQFAEHFSKIKDAGCKFCEKREKIVYTFEEFMEKLSPNRRKRVSHLEFKKLHTEAVMPSRAYEFDAGMDLFSLEEVLILPNERYKISTGIACNIPEEHYLQLYTRSSTAKRGGIVLGGVCDSSYKGELFVVLHNLSKEPLKVSKLDKVAQAILHPIAIPIPIEGELTPSLGRGIKGFGSSDEDAR